MIAKLSKDMGILTVGIVSVPARFEGPKRLDQARDGLRRLKDHVDCLIVIDNEKSNRSMDRKLYRKLLQKPTMY